MPTMGRGIVRLAAAVALFAVVAVGCSFGLREELTEACVTSGNRSREICGHVADCMVSRAGDYGISRGDLSEAMRTDSWDHKPELDESAWNSAIRKCIATKQQSSSDAETPMRAVIVEQSAEPMDEEETLTGEDEGWISFQSDLHGQDDLKPGADPGPKAGTYVTDSFYLAPGIWNFSAHVDDNHLEYLGDSDNIFRVGLVDESGVLRQLASSDDVEYGRWGPILLLIGDNQAADAPPGTYWFEVSVGLSARWGVIVAREPLLAAPVTMSDNQTRQTAAVNLPEGRWQITASVEDNYFVEADGRAVVDQPELFEVTALGDYQRGHHLVRVPLVNEEAVKGQWTVELLVGGDSDSSMPPGPVWFSVRAGSNYRSKWTISVDPA